MTPAAEAPFVRAIAAAGSDPTPRLVFADWLDDHTQPERAAFIRDQVLVANTPADCPERRAAAKRAFDAERKFGKRWAGPLARHAHDCQFRLGFPDMVGLTSAKLRRNAPVLFAHSPIRSLLVTGIAGNLAPLAAIPADNGVERLSLWGARLTGQHLPALASLTNWPRLTTLSLLFNSLTDADIPALTGHPFFLGLARLELGANPLTDAGREGLRAAFGERVGFECEREDDWLYNIENDDPFYNGASPDGVQYLTLDGANGTEVARFDFAGNVLGVETHPYGEVAEDADRPLLERLGAQESDVRVKRFALANGRAIRGLMGAFAADARHTAEEFEFAHDVLEQWLTEGEFAFGNCILNRAGEVTAT